MFKILTKKEVSKEEIELAFESAKETFKRKINIAKNFDLEFLLFLSGKKDIREAKKWAENGKEEIEIEFNLEKIISIKGAKREKAEIEEIERISVSRIS
jgi:tRNA threonylcarbamoyladenosine modification (KEOPS) complex Cgi121 subunit